MTASHPIIVAASAKDSRALVSELEIFAKANQKTWPDLLIPLVSFDDDIRTFVMRHVVLRKNGQGDHVVIFEAPVRA